MSENRLDGMHMGIVTLGVRLVLGFVFYSAGIRRFFCSPEKLDPHSAAYMAYKINHAMPGALFGVDKLIDYILRHPELLYILIIGITLVELIAGLGLMFGLLTRFCAVISLLLSLKLMLIFGWLGSTCLDEWTMSAYSFAMGCCLLVAGGGKYSMDYVMESHSKTWKNSRILQTLGGINISHRLSKRLSIILAVVAFLYVIGFYHYLHGCNFGPVEHRVNMTKHNIAITQLHVTSNNVTFDAYVNAGPDTQGAYVVDARLQNAKGETLARWSASSLKTLPMQDIHNRYTFSKFSEDQAGLTGATGAKAHITLPLPQSAQLQPGPYRLTLESIDGRQWVS